MLGDGRVLAVAAHALMRGDALALEEDFDRPRGDPCLDRLAGEAIGHGVEVVVDIDMVVDADPARPPFGEDIGLGGQRSQKGPVQLLKQLAPRDSEPADGPDVIQMMEELGDGLVQLGEAVEGTMSQPAQKPALDDQHCGLHLGLVLWLSRSRREDRHVVMGRHLGIAAVDHRIEVAGLDHRHLGIVGNEEPRGAADRLERYFSRLQGKREAGKSAA